jgi:hypothetical protein
MALQKMINLRILLISFLCLLTLNINASEPSPSEKGCQGQHDSSLLNKAQDAIIYAALGYVAYKIIPPIIDRVEKNINYAYLNYWLTEEQRIVLQAKQEKEYQELAEEYEKAAMKHAILFTKTKRGEEILLREKEQEIRHNNLLIKGNELIIIATEREESSKQVAYLEELRSKTSDSQLQNDLQKKRDDEIRKWMNSR